MERPTEGAVMLCLSEKFALFYGVCDNEEVDCHFIYFDEDVIFYDQ
jgi:hypothetical protein